MILNENKNYMLLTFTFFLFECSFIALYYFLADFN